MTPSPNPDWKQGRASLVRVPVGEISLSVTVAGPADSAKVPVLLLHGFPEIAYSWRHQISALSEAGHFVVAPDQRGYGASDCPANVEDYSIIELVGDAIAVLDHFDIERAVIAGHDWGSIVAGALTLLRPERVAGTMLMSVPYLQRGDLSPIDHIRATDPEGPYDYILAFQEPGIEAFFDADPIATLRSAHWANSGEAPDGWVSGDPLPTGLPSYLTAGDFEAYTRAFARSGAGGGINWYRNLHRNWELLRPWHKARLQPPVAYLAGSKDFVANAGDGGLGSSIGEMEQNCADFRGATMIEGVGHWVQQEAPEPVNEVLAAFIAGLAS